MGGGNNPISINQIISQIELALGKKSKLHSKPFHIADMMTTWADISKAYRILGWKPQVPLNEGVIKTVEWHKSNRSWLADIQL